MRLDFIACKYTHFIQYGKTIEYFFAKRIRNFAEIKRISPPNGSHKTITKKQGVHRAGGDLIADNVLLINAYVWAKNSIPTLEATYSR